MIIRNVIYRCRYEHEKHNAEAAVAQELGEQIPAVFLVLSMICTDDPVQCPYDRKPRAGIDAGPFTRRADAEEQAGQCEITFLPVLAPQVHEQVHQQDEEHRVGVDRGDARLHIVHEIRRKYDSSEHRNHFSAEKLLQKYIHHRQHEDSEERSHEAPAERCHAEERNSDADYQLAERRVADLVRPDVLLVLYRRADMVDLVKVAGVHEARRVRYMLLFVAQLRSIGGCYDELIAVRAVHRDLVQIHIVIGGYTEITHRFSRDRIAQLYLFPLEHRDIVLRKFSGVVPVLAVFRTLNVIISDIYAAEHAQLAYRHGALKLHGDALTGRENVRVLRRLGIAEADERDYRVAKRDHRRGEPVAALHFALRRLGAFQRAFLQRGQTHIKQNYKQRRQYRQQVSYRHSSHRGTWPQVQIIRGRSRNTGKI